MVRGGNGTGVREHIVSTSDSRIGHHIRYPTVVRKADCGAKHPQLVFPTCGVAFDKLCPGHTVSFDPTCTKTSSDLIPGQLCPQAFAFFDVDVAYYNFAAEKCEIN